MCRASKINLKLRISEVVILFVVIVTVPVTGGHMKDPCFRVVESGKELCECEDGLSPALAVNCPHQVGEGVQLGV